MDTRFRSLKLLFILILGALLPLPASVSGPSSARAARAPAPLAQSARPTELPPEGVANLHRVNSTLYFQNTCSKFHTPAQEISRMATTGGETRFLFQEPQCTDLRFNSEIVADENFVYWVEDAGLVRLSRNANPGDQPQVLSAAIAGQHIDLADNKLYVLAMVVTTTSDPLVTTIYRVDKATGQTKVLLQRPRLLLQIELDDDGNMYWLDTASYPYDLYTAIYLDTPSPVVPALVAREVLQYYVEGTHTVCDAGCAATNYVYYTHERSLVRLDRMDGARKTLYTSTHTSTKPIGIYSIGSYLDGSKPPELFFFESRQQTCGQTPGQPQNWCTYDILLIRLPKTLIPEVIYQTGTEYSINPPNGFEEDLTAADGFVFWVFNGRAYRLPHDVQALPNNLRITGVEVTQGVQYPDNRERLIQNRRTFVRVYAQADGLTDAPNITARLTAEGKSEILQPINGVYEGSSRTSLTVPRTPLRTMLDHSFLFELPQTWLHGTLTLSATINPFNAPMEPRGDNTQNVTVTFDQPTHLLTFMVPFSYDIDGAHYDTSQSEIDAIVSYIRRLYPVPNAVDPYTTHEGYGPGFAGPMFMAGLGERVAQRHSDCKDMDADERDLCATDYIKAYLEEVNAQRDYSLLWYGMIASNGGAYGVRGSSRIEAGVAAGISDSVETAAHEIGHLLHRYHPNMCGVTEDDGHIDEDFPYPGAHLGPDEGTYGGVMGIDLGDPALGVTPSLKYWFNHADIMSYCPFAKWLSDNNYNAIYDKLEKGTAQTASLTAPSRQAGDFLSVFGTLLPGANKAIVHRITRIPSVVTIPERVPGPYSIVLLNAQGGLLADYPFTPEHGDHIATAAAGAGSQRFGQIVPFVAGTVQVRIIRLADKAVLKSIAVSPQRPTLGNVALVNPPNPVKGSVTLRWTASDADGNPLTFDVYYSRDGGQTFEPLQVEVHGGSTTIDADRIGGGSVRFRVIAHDGVHTTQSDSPAYTVAIKPPRPRILNVGSSIKLLYGQNINLVGEANDTQDGQVAENRRVWTNQKGTVLGRGSALALTKLPAGATRITLTATNSAGLSASTSVDIMVDDVLDPPGPTLAVEPTTVNWSVAPGAAKQTATLTIANAGGGQLNWAASEQADWLTLSTKPANSGTAPASLVLTADPAGLPPGVTLKTTLAIRATNTAQPQVINIPVTLNIEDRAPVVVGNGTPASCTAEALRVALETVKQAGGGRVRFACGLASHTISLSATLTVLAPTAIDGGGQITLNGAGQRIFQLCSPAAVGADNIALYLSGLTLTDGGSNTNQAGGAITNYGCRLTVARTQFVGNHAVYEAGAINNLFDGALTVEDSAFVGNRASTIGGAIVSQGGPLVVRNSVFRDNQADGGNGGAIYAYDAASVQILGSSFIANHASSRGGAFSTGGTTIVANSTFWENTAGLGGAAIRHHAAAGEMTLINVTVAGEQGPSLSGSITLRNSLVSNGSGVENCEGSITAIGPNLEYPSTSCHASVSGRDPLLAPLAEQPGLPPFLPHTSASPARDAGDNTICAAEPVNGIDQRGRSRPLPIGGQCDLGAYEFDPTSQ
jgi:predicted outer membrane repeat protein